MKCPECGKPTVVIATFKHAEAEIRRRRKCLGKDQHRFNTWEVAADVSSTDLSKEALRLFTIRLANRGFTKEAIENILSLD